MSVKAFLAQLTICGAMAVAGSGDANAQARENPFKNAKTWAFQLKNLDPVQQAKIAASPYDVVVIDSEDYPNGIETQLTPAEIDAMKKKPDGSRRLVLAYFSIGEAESYRYYWKPEWNKKKPGWVGKENKEWKENFVVKYWIRRGKKSSMGSRPRSPIAFWHRVLTASTSTARTPITMSATTTT